jgi:hypothetical protein
MSTLVRVKGSFLERWHRHPVIVSEFVISPMITIKRWYELGMNRTKSGKWWSTESIPKGVQHDSPITDVSWYDCQEFISRLNKSRLDKSAFRLPTQAELELSYGRKIFNNRQAGDWCQDYHYRGYYNYSYFHWNGKGWSDRNSLNYTTGLPGMQSFDKIEKYAGLMGLKIPRYNPKGPQPGQEIKCYGRTSGRVIKYKEITIEVPSLEAIDWRRVVMLPDRISKYDYKSDWVLPTQTYSHETSYLNFYFGFRVCRTCR